MTEFEKCKSNIVYFIEKYCLVINADGTKSKIKLRKYQKTYLKNGKRT